MTQTHEDRIAERQPHQCAAYGCPMEGGVSASTSGTGGEWWCMVHFGADAGSYQAITAELNRLHWLVCIIRDVRQYGPRTPGSRQAFAVITKALANEHRQDLMPVAGEYRSYWLMRLEDELRRLVRENVSLRMPKQQALVTEQPADTFSKVGFDMPA